MLKIKDNVDLKELEKLDLRKVKKIMYRIYDAKEYKEITFQELQKRLDELKTLTIIYLEKIENETLYFREMDVYDF